MRKRALIVHPFVRPHGGGQAVAAWALQAFAETAETTLLAYEEPDLPALNRTFGCALRPGDFDIVLPPAWARLAVSSFPTNGALLEQSALARVARGLVRRQRFDGVLSTNGEADLGGVAAMYVHFPHAYWPRPDPAPDWKHNTPILTPAYRNFCNWLGGSTERMRRQRFLANSSWVARHIRIAHGAEARVVFPPVPGGFPDNEWSQREPAFVGIGRLHPVKSWPRAVEIIRRVRERGHLVRLRIIGPADGGEDELLELARRHDWFEVLIDPPRPRMLEIVSQSRYGLHSMIDEHFGIAVAELLRAGCLTFVHRSGGPPEIVGGQEDLLFGDVPEAVDKICAALEDRAIQERLLQSLAERRGLFSEERFMREIRAAVLP